MITVSSIVQTIAVSNGWVTSILSVKTAEKSCVWSAGSGTTADVGTPHGGANVLMTTTNAPRSEVNEVGAVEAKDVRPRSLPDNAPGLVKGARHQRVGDPLADRGSLRRLEGPPCSA